MQARGSTCTVLGKPKCIHLYAAVEEALKACQQKRKKKLNAKFSQGDVVILRNGKRGVFNKICRKYARVNKIQSDGQVNMRRWWTVRDPESLHKAEGEARVAFPQQSALSKGKNSKNSGDTDEEMEDEEPQPALSSSSTVDMTVDG